MLSMFTMYHSDGDREHEMIYSFLISIPFCFGQHKIVTMSDTEFQGYVLTFVQLFMSNVSLHIAITSCMLRLLIKHVTCIFG